MSELIEPPTPEELLRVCDTLFEMVVRRGRKISALEARVEALERRLNMRVVPEDRGDTPVGFEITPTQRERMSDCEHCRAGSAPCWRKGVKRWAHPGGVLCQDPPASPES